MTVNKISIFYIYSITAVCFFFNSVTTNTAVKLLEEGNLTDCTFMHLFVSMSLQCCCLAFLLFTGHCIA